MPIKPDPSITTRSSGSALAGLNERMTGFGKGVGDGVGVGLGVGAGVGVGVGEGVGVGVGSRKVYSALTAGSSLS